VAKPLDRAIHDALAAPRPDGLTARVTFTNNLFPTDVGGRPAHAVTASPAQQGGLLGSLRLAWDAVTGTPLSLGVIAKDHTAPALELSLRDVTCGPVAAGDVDLSPPSTAHVVDLGAPAAAGRHGAPVVGLPAVRQAAGFPAAELSHELRTPLARISGETEVMLRRDRTPDEYREALGSIQRSADTMARTVETLVSAARQEADSTRATSDVRDVVTSAIGNARRDPAAPGIQVSLPEKPVRVAVDGELAERMLQPLLDNATRYARSTAEPNDAGGRFTLMLPLAPWPLLRMRRLGGNVRRALGSRIPAGGEGRIRARCPRPS